jgi:hypothetical protein
MACVCILRGATERHYIGSTENLARRVAEHQRGTNYMTCRLGGNLKLTATKERPSMVKREARKESTPYGIKITIGKIEALEPHLKSSALGYGRDRLLGCRSENFGALGDRALL